MSAVDGGAAVVNYRGLNVFDANGTDVPAWFEECPAPAACGLQPPALRLVVDDSAAVYPLTIDPIAQQAYLKASNTGANDQFGYSVAISGDTVVVGALYEDSNATGVNGNQGNNSAADAGAAYVFVRSGGVWSQQAYLKASNTGANDRFGYSVAVSGDTVVVGATGEASSATGIDGNQADNSAASSGAAYVFTGLGPQDADGDGVPDVTDGCPNDPNKTTPGACGCGNPETDSDGDSVPDCVDGCPNDPNKIAPASAAAASPTRMPMPTACPTATTAVQTIQVRPLQETAVAAFRKRIAVKDQEGRPHGLPVVSSSVASALCPRPCSVSLA